MLIIERRIYHCLYRRNPTINASQTRRQEILEERDRTWRTWRNLSKLVCKCTRDSSTHTRAFDGTSCNHGSQKKSSQVKKMVRIGAPLDAISGLSFLNHREMRFRP
jgi:hypothetical protein